MKTEKMTMLSNSKKKEYKRWEKSIKKDKTEKSIRVEEAENGFVITISVCTYGPEYSDDRKIYISKTNPLDKEMPIDTTESAENDINAALEAFDEAFG